MDPYHITLFIHIATLVVAAGAASVVKLAVSRRLRARTVGDALEWHNVMMSTARAFPACIVTFLVTGFYMVSLTGGSRMSLGYVQAGVVGVTLLLASGAYLGKQGGRLKKMLEAAAARDAEAAPPRVKPPTLVRVLPVVNTGIAMSVAFDMITKPTSLPVALGIVALGGIVSGIAALRQGAPRSSTDASAATGFAPT